MTTRTQTLFLATALLAACGGTSPGEETKEAFQEMVDGDGTWKDAGNEWKDVGDLISGKDADGFSARVEDALDDLGHELERVGDPGPFASRMKDLRKDLKALGEQTGDAWEEAATSVKEGVEELGRDIEQSVEG